MADVRRCRSEDFTDVLALLHQLWPSEPLDEDALSVVYRWGLASDAQVYLCATEWERVIGFGSLSLKSSLWQRGYFGHIDELVVDSGHRGRGFENRAYLFSKRL